MPRERKQEPDGRNQEEQEMLSHVSAKKVAIREHAQRRVEGEEECRQAEGEVANPTLPAKEKKVENEDASRPGKDDWIQGPGGEKEL
jgi:hypothetical protein